MSESCSKLSCLFCSLRQIENGRAGAAIDLTVDAMFDKLALELVGDAPDALPSRRTVQLRQPHDDGAARFRLDLRAGQILQLLAHVLHADASSERRVDLERFLRDAGGRFSSFSMPMQRAHVVQPVDQLHQQHTDVVGHGEHELAEILRLLRARSAKTSSCEGLSAPSTRAAISSPKFLATLHSTR